MMAHAEANMIPAMRLGKHKRDENLGKRVEEFERAIAVARARAARVHGVRVD
jgi:hypothetical protein